MFGWMKRKRVVPVVRLDRVPDKTVLENLKISRDHHALVAVREIGRRLEESILDEAFDGRPDERLRNLARMEGVRELLGLLEEWRDRAQRPPT
jgi:hypothetical protein